MLGYRKRSFARAHALLQNLRANLEDLEALRELQMLVLREVIRAEEKIRELKAQLRTIEEATDTATTRRTAYLDNRIEGFRQCAYIWRCFGDAIAFLYMDKYALKQCFYSTETVNAKQDAGFILGKQGLANELAMLESALKHGVPAVLVDLTNTIRHGDVCLMGESDPCLIEVKASKRLNDRGKKQKRSLEKLRTFYEADKCAGLRGFPELRRKASETPERTYVDQINECIREAVKDGYAVRQPEQGLHYIVMTQKAPNLEQILGSLKLNSLWPFFLNEPKSDRIWAPYFPFILTIEEWDHLWKFIRGNLFIVVFVELDALCKVALDEGCKATFDLDDELRPLRIEVPDGGKVYISSHILTRDPRAMWQLSGFCISGEGADGQNLVRHFNPLPPPAHYFDTPTDLLYDARAGKPELDWNHIVIENIRRYPTEFLEDHCPSGFALEADPEASEDHGEQYYRELGRATEADNRTYRRIMNRMKDAVDLSIKRVLWNFKTAIPQYYPRVRRLQLLLPVCLVSDEQVDLALAVERTDSGSYLGHTVLPLDWAYRNARLICRPDSDWLSPEGIIEKGGEEQEP
jgi:hypothetical protein